MTFEENYAKLAPRVTNWLVANGSAYAVACEIVQETFLRVWKMRDELVDDEAQVSGLVWTIARNLRNDYARKARHETLQDEIRDEGAPDGGGAAPWHPPESSEDIVYLRRRLTAAFAELPPLLREAYTLFQVGGLSIREIAQRTNVTESLVKVRIFRAKEKLRPILADLVTDAPRG